MPWGRVRCPIIPPANTLAGCTRRRAACRCRNLDCNTPCPLRTRCCRTGLPLRTRTRRVNCPRPNLPHRPPPLGRYRCPHSRHRRFWDHSRRWDHRYTHLRPRTGIQQFPRKTAHPEWASVRVNIRPASSRCSKPPCSIPGCPTPRTIELLPDSSLALLSFLSPPQFTRVVLLREPTEHRNTLAPVLPVATGDCPCIRLVDL